MSKLSYLVDTGAEVSVLPPRSEDRDRSLINTTLTFQIGVHIYVYLFSEISPSYTFLLGSIRLLDLCQIHPIRFLFGLCKLITLKIFNIFEVILR